jgi:hypothetical protein
MKSAFKQRRKLMATENQIAANRDNAKKSTGPKTTEGKTKSSKNALKHGLTTPYGLLPGESEEEYMYHREELLDELYPDSSIEHYLADRIVYLSWALKRAAHFTRVTLHELLGRTCGNPLPRRRHPDVYLARMVVKDFSDNHVIERLEIYERRIENSLYKTMREYEKQKKQSRDARKDAPHAEPPSPADLSPEYARLWQDPPRYTTPPESHPQPGDPSTQLPHPGYQAGTNASPLLTPPQGVLRTDSGLLNPVLNKRTQFEVAEISHNSYSENDLHQDAPSDGDSEQTRSDLSEIKSHPLIRTARTLGSEITAMRAFLNDQLCP